MKKKVFLTLTGIHLAVGICAVILFLLAPRTALRELAVSLSLGKSRICYYIPGELTEVKAGSPEISCQVSSRQYKDGTILYIEAEKEEETQEPVSRIIITFQNHSPRQGEQEPFTEDMETVSWVEVYTGCAYRDLEQGYCFGGEQPGIYNTGHYYTEERLQDGEKRAFGNLAMAAGIFLTAGILAAWLDRRKRRKRARKCRELERAVSQYLSQYPASPAHPEISRWIKRMAKRMVWIYYGLITGAEYGFAAWAAFFPSPAFLPWTLLFLLLWPFAWAAVLFWEENRFRGMINPLIKREPVDALRYYYQYDHSRIFGQIWGINGLMYANCMTQNQSWRESAALADRIWYFFGKRDRGTWYLVYHYLQLRNYRGLGDEGWERYYLARVTREARKRPRNRLYQNIRKAIESRGDGVEKKDSI